jgi:hypothetical protein
MPCLARARLAGRKHGGRVRAIASYRHDLPRLLNGRFGILAVQIVQVDRLDAQALQRGFARLSEIQP